MVTTPTASTRRALAHPVAPVKGLGLRGRLLLAFFGISAFAVIAALAAMVAFMAAGDALDLIAEERVPPALDALEASRQAERIIAGAPALLAAETSEQREQESEAIDRKFARLQSLLSSLRDTPVDADALAEVDSVASQLGDNLQAVDSLVAERLTQGSAKSALVREAIDVNGQIQRLLAPWVQVTESRIVQLREMSATADDSGGAVDLALREHVRANDVREQLRQAQLEASMISDGLLQVAGAANRDDIAVAGFRLRRRLGTLAELTASLDPKLQTLLSVQVAALARLIEEEPSITGLRGRELELRDAAAGLSQQNLGLVGRLTAAINDVVAGARSDIETAKQEARSTQRLSARVLLAVVACSVISSILIVWLYVGRNIVARLTALSRSMLAIAGGDLRTELPAAASDEVGQMAMALHAFRDAAVVRDVFGKYVPESVAEAIVASRGQLAPMQATATILYSDLESFTTIAERMSPGQVVDMLNEYFTAVIEPINRHGGIVNQFQGDAMLVTFNVPVEDPRHADQALAAAMEIQQVVAGRKFSGTRLRTRIGITTGPVIAGNVGSGDRLSYTVHGDVVNLAARLEQLNKELGTRILVSRDTVAMLTGSYPLEPVGEVEIRGKGRSAEIFRLDV